MRKNERLLAFVQPVRTGDGYTVHLRKAGDMSLVYTVATDDLAYAGVLAGKVNEAATYDTVDETAS